MKQGAGSIAKPNLGPGSAPGVLWCFSVLWGTAACCADPARPLVFERDVWPIIARNCAGCHGVDQPKAGLDLRSVSTMLRGGKSGPALDRSDPEASLLLMR